MYLIIAIDFFSNKSIMFCKLLFFILACNSVINARTIKRKYCWLSASSKSNSNLYHLFNIKSKRLWNSWCKKRFFHFRFIFFCSLFNEVFSILNNFETRKFDKCVVCKKNQFFQKHMNDFFSFWFIFVSCRIFSSTTNPRFFRWNLALKTNSTLAICAFFSINYWHSIKVFF